MFQSRKKGWFITKSHLELLVLAWTPWGFLECGCPCYMRISLPWQTGGVWEISIHAMRISLILCLHLEGFFCSLGMKSRGCSLLIPLSAEALWGQQVSVGSGITSCWIPLNPQEWPWVNMRQLKAAWLSFRKIFVITNIFLISAFSRPRSFKGLWNCFRS